MATQFAENSRNAQVDAVCALQNGGFISIYTGAEPANIVTGASGVLLATFNLPNPAYGSAADDGSGDNSEASLNPTPTTNAVAAGTASYYRAYTGGGASDGNQAVQGSVSGTGGGGDMEITNPVIADGEPLSISNYRHVQPRI